MSLGRAACVKLGLSNSFFRAKKRIADRPRGPPEDATGSKEREREQCLQCKSLCCDSRSTGVLWYNSMLSLFQRFVRVMTGSGSSFAQEEHVNHATWEAASSPTGEDYFSGMPSDAKVAICRFLDSRSLASLSASSKARPVT